MRRRNAALVVVVLIAVLAVYSYYELTATTNEGSSTLSTSISSVSSATSTTSSLTSTITSTTSSITVASTTVSSQSTTGGNWTTYHADDARVGYEDVASISSVGLSWTSAMLDGAVYAEPLVLGDSVFIATENNSVYSLDAQTGTVNWKTNLGAPVPGNALQCGDIDPSGITGTPVVDTSSDVIFVVAFSDLHHFLYGLDLQTGAIVSNRSAEPPNFVVTAQQQRSALSLSDGIVYIPYGGLAGDCGAYHGWVVGLTANGTGTMVVYQVPSQRESGIWAPSGAAIGSSGTLYISDGNGASDTKFDLGDSVIGLTPTLEETGFFAPSNWLQLNEGDGDLGSVGPSIVGPDTLFQIGKQGVGYLLKSSRLGGIGGQLFSGSVCNGGYGGTAQDESLLFVPCTNGLFALQLGSSSFGTRWHSTSFFAGPPIVTGSVVWTVDTSSSVLYGYDVSSGAQLYSFQLGPVVHFCTPSAGDGSVFVAENDVVQAFGLTFG
ncbi:MAG: PQQ-binding-like beta-propeller repeat protein [Nitrososphaerota archaeon]|nr:PQQ-binding-like beta-propeller repeat protein [Nitrososphaerota archaeon]